MNVSDDPAFFATTVVIFAIAFVSVVGALCGAALLIKAAVNVWRNE